MIISYDFFLGSIQFYRRVSKARRIESSHFGVEAVGGEA